MSMEFKSRRKESKSKEGKKGPETVNPDVEEVRIHHVSHWIKIW